ncbi:MAG: hypothetical protein Q8N88_03135 [Nanoarchaeota archaeon]|nr:hypothetical protein [Nanoarchaeota archaeon]
MKAMLQFKKFQKKGVSEIVAYVLLITLTISISILVYAWLKLYFNPSDAEECPDGVNVIVTNYSCVSGSAGLPGSLQITLKNKGMFSFDGYLLRVHDDPNATFGIYTLGLKSGNEVEIAPGNSLTKNYELGSLNKITYLEIQPFIDSKKNRVLCKDYTSMKISCSDSVID